MEDPQRWEIDLQAPPPQVSDFAVQLQQRDSEFHGHGMMKHNSFNLRIAQDKAAVKIQSLYRGYQSRKWSREQLGAQDMDKVYLKHVWISSYLSGRQN